MIHTVYAKLSEGVNLIARHHIVDWSSVEVFANDGQRVITDLIFPDSASNGLDLFAKEGSLRVESLKLYRLTSGQREKNIKLNIIYFESGNFTWGWIANRLKGHFPGEKMIT